MQQTFQCYRCGAQNYIGQPFCWNCQSQFQWNCPNCKAPVQNTMINCPYCHILLPWPSNQNDTQPANYQIRNSYQDWRQPQYINLITICDTGNVALKSRQEKTIWCADSLGAVTILIIPIIAWYKVANETTTYSQQISVVPICLGINTNNPLFLPATMPTEYALKLHAIELAFKDTYDIPLMGSKMIQEIFANITPAQFDNGKKLGVALNRIKYKRDLYTRHENGGTISIIHTCLANEKAKPYSILELYRLKMEGFRRWVSD